MDYLRVRRPAVPGIAEVSDAGRPSDASRMPWRGPQRVSVHDERVTTVFEATIKGCLGQENRPNASKLDFGRVGSRTPNLGNV